MTATIDYSIGFTKGEVEAILAVQKAELQKTLVAWTDSNSSATKRRIDEIHAVIAACQRALQKFDPVAYPLRPRTAQAQIVGELPQ